MILQWNTKLKFQKIGLSTFNIKINMGPRPEHSTHDHKVSGFATARGHYVVSLIKTFTTPIVPTIQVKKGVWTSYHPGKVKDNT